MSRKGCESIGEEASTTAGFSGYAHMHAHAQVVAMSMYIGLQCRGTKVSGRLAPLASPGVGQLLDLGFPSHTLYH